MANGVIVLDKRAATFEDTDSDAVYTKASPVAATATSNVEDKLYPAGAVPQTP